MKGALFRYLMLLIQHNDGFALAQELLAMSQEDRDEFGQHWIEFEKQHDGLSSDDLDKVGENIAAPVESADELSKRANDLFFLLNTLEGQVDGVETTIKQDGIWGFVFQIPVFGKFTFPYTSVAMSACNRLIQYGSEKGVNRSRSVDMTS